jgi:hypothetical protein
MVPRVLWGPPHHLVLNLLICQAIPVVNEQILDIDTLRFYYFHRIRFD